MSIIELCLIGIGLSMDAFAASICKGLTLNSLEKSKMLIAGLFFGGFQFLMPVIGYYVGYNFRDAISDVDHWVAFFLLVWIGITMISDSRKKVEESPDFSVKTMFPLALATSIDALAVGVSLAILRVNIWASATLIGLITLVLSMLGVWVGHIFGSRYKVRAEIAGGVILILIGTKILLNHLGIINF